VRNAPPGRALGERPVVLPARRVAPRPGPGVTAAVAPPSLAAVAARVDARVLEVLGAELDRWRLVDDELEVPFAALRDLVAAGGKRLRPAFCHWAFVGAGGDPDDPAVVDAGAALELLHTFALIHDDIMDGSATRRGAPAAHVCFEDRHRRRVWRGERRRFGEGVAILLGDLAFVYADVLLAGAPPAAVRVFAELRIEVNVGQYLDLVGTARGRASEAEARRISLFKSGKYTVERPLHLGAALAGRADLDSALSDYGLPLGEAFQLRDDLLGALGQGSITGKPVGEDLREGKPTVLVAVARRRVAGADAALLGRYGAPDITDGEVSAIQELLERCGAVARVEAAIEDLVASAVGALESAPLAPAARAALGDLAAFVAGRDH